MSSCCVNCFEDKFLKEYIRRDGSIGDCQYCGSSEVYCIDADCLADFFEPVVDLYEPVEEGVHYIADCGDPYQIGSTLSQLLNEDWEIFSDRLIDNNNEERLIDDIVSGEITAADLWVSKDRALTHQLPEEKWDEFVHYIKHERRFIPNLPEYKDPREWLQHRFMISEFKRSAGFPVFRARIGYKIGERGEKRTYDISEMGAPTPQEARGGRANPPGIPFLYTALDQATAVAEIRPWKGALVSVASLFLQREIVIIDLANIPPLETPFGIENLGWVLESREMLSIIGEKLAQPIDPQTSEIEYVSTQYITELIRDLTYDGILYKSALGPNSNLVLFDPNVARIESVELVNVTDVLYSFEPYRENEN